MAKIDMVVYPPPAAGLPYLVVILHPNGTVTARPFASHDEADNFLIQTGPKVQAEIDRQRNA